MECPDIHSHTISAAEGDATEAPSSQIKEGCATLLWAYLRDYQQENTTSQSTVGGRSVIVYCQTSKVPLTASFLTFSSNEFIFHSLVFWRHCHLRPNVALFLPPCVLRANDNSVRRMYEERMFTSRKGHIKHQMNGQFHK